MRETGVSVAINAALSAVFTLLVFGARPTLAATGQGGFAVDFVVQAAIIGLMSALAPCALAAVRVRAGRLGEGALGPFGPRAVIVRTVVSAAVAALGLGGLAMAAAWTSDSLSLPVLVAVKVAFGAGVAAIVTPLALMSLLGQGRSRASPDIHQIDGR